MKKTTAQHQFNKCPTATPGPEGTNDDHLPSNPVSIGWRGPHRPDAVSEAIWVDFAKAYFGQRLLSVAQLHRLCDGWIRSSNSRKPQDGKSYLVPPSIDQFKRLVKAVGQQEHAIDRTIHGNQ